MPEPKNDRQLVYYKDWTKAGLPQRNWSNEDQAQHRIPTGSYNTSQTCVSPPSPGWNKLRNRGNPGSYPT